MFPQKSERKALFELDNDYLTKQNTMKNHVSITSLKSSDVRMWYRCSHDSIIII